MGTTLNLKRKKEENASGQFTLELRRQQNT